MVYIGNPILVMYKCIENGLNRYKIIKNIKLIQYWPIEGRIPDDFGVKTAQKCEMAIFFFGVPDLSFYSPFPSSWVHRVLKSISLSPSKKSLLN